MPVPATEIVFLPLKSSVRPEDDNDKEGAAFLKALASVKSGFGGMVWGRSVDKPDIMGIGIELISTTRFPLDKLVPFQSAEPSTLAVWVNPIDLVPNPVTEIAIIPLREDLAADQKTDAGNNAVTFGKALLAAPAPSHYSGRMCLTYRYSWAEDAQYKHKNRLVMMIGWREVQNHLDSMETDVFKENLQPISDVAVGDIDVTHFKFKEL